ncbi:MAG: hypothetical protein RLZZ385_662 [Pseudomonadota bacterium]|jgi:hypothetical protein
MATKLATSGILAAALVASLGLQAQPGSSGELRNSIEILSGVLAQGLQLDDSPGLFGINQGQVSSVYLQEQGVLLEIRSPLANRRSRIALGSLATSLENLGFSGNPFDVMVMQAEADRPETMAFVWREEDTGDVTRELLDHIRDIDFSATINAALRQSGFAMRSLQELGEADEALLSQLQSDMDALRTDLQSRQVELQELQARVRTQAEQLRTVDTQALRAQLDEELTGLAGRMTELRDAATGKVAELQALNAQARERYTLQWQNQVGELETTLYRLLCDYGATLRELPDGEFITVVLKGLGETADGDVQADKIHVLGKADLQQCQSGSIQVTELRERATVYSY